MLLVCTSWLLARACLWMDSMPWWAIISSPLRPKILEYICKNGTTTCDISTWICWHRVCVKHPGNTAEWFPMVFCFVKNWKELCRGIFARCLFHSEVFQRPEKTVVLWLGQTKNIKKKQTRIKPSITNKNQKRNMGRHNRRLKTLTSNHMFILGLSWSLNKFGNCAACAAQFFWKCQICWQRNYMCLIVNTKTSAKIKNCNNSNNNIIRSAEIVRLNLPNSLKAKI